eukprot:353951-Chlamydomonas_euryale.AAC.7
MDREAPCKEEELGRPDRLGSTLQGGGAGSARWEGAAKCLAYKRQFGQLHALSHKTHQGPPQTHTAPAPSIPSPPPRLREPPCQHAHIHRGRRPTDANSCPPNAYEAPTTQHPSP